MANVKEKFKPYSLNCGSGIVVEVSKGAFIGTDEDGEFVLVDDICDAYIGVEGEFDDEIRNWTENEPMAGYPKQYKIEKSVKILDEKVIDDDEADEELEKVMDKLSWANGSAFKGGI